jgi:hypothetical protein
LGALSTLTPLILFHILARLSEKFGSVLKMPPLYKWFYVAEVLVGFALVVHLLQASAYLSNPVAPPEKIWAITGVAFTLVFYQIPLAIAVTIGFIITWKYWGWLLTERKS